MDMFPNKNRLIRALDFYTTAMRDIVFESLKTISNESLPLKQLVNASLPPKLYEKDISRMHTDKDIHDALEEKHFPYLLKHNWDECFKARFGNDRNTVCLATRKLTDVRNRLAHRKGGDPDDRYTLRYLDSIVDILRKFKLVDEQQSVEMIRNELKETGGTVLNTDEDNMQSAGEELDETGVRVDTLNGCKQAKTASLTVRPGEDILGTKLGDLSYKNGETWVAWLVGDEPWIVHTSETSIVATRVESKRIDAIQAIDEVIHLLWYAENCASDDEPIFDRTGDGDWIELNDIYEENGVWIEKSDIENEIGKMERCKKDLLHGLFHLPILIEPSVDKEPDGQEAPMSVYPVGDSIRLGTDATTGESFWKVGDSFWCSSERRNETVAKKMDEEVIRRSQVISQFISA